ncbi:MAG: hypothetical protein RSB99_00080 [Bacilli bacterium]
MKAKQIKKENKNKKKLVMGTETKSVETSRVILISVVVLVTFFAVYFVTAIVTGEIKLWEKETKVDTVIQNQEILAGETFVKSEKTYYVLYMNFTDLKASPLIAAADIYSKKTNHNMVYFVDMEKGFNLSYVAGELPSNSAAQKIDELKVKAPTIIKVENKKAVSYIEGYEEIDKYLTELSK